MERIEEKLYGHTEVDSKEKGRKKVCENYIQGFFQNYCSYDSFGVVDTFLINTATN
jgi:hypothetical protein